MKTYFCAMQNKAELRIFLCLLQTFFYVAHLSAQNKIFKSIQSGQYAKAKEMIINALKKNHADPVMHYNAAWFYIQEDHADFRPDSAWYHIVTCADILKKITDEKQMAKYAAQGVRPATVSLLQNVIEKRAYEIADSINTIDGWEHFITRFTGASRHGNAIEKRNALAFEAAKENFSYQSFKEFMEKYPNASQLTEARQLYESLLYKTLTQSATWKAYKDFIDKYPESPYVDEARAKYEQLLFEEYAAKHDAREYARFIKQYPDNRYVPQAEDSLYRLSVTEGSAENLYRFIQLYPKNKNIREAWLRLYYLVTADFTTQSLDYFETHYPLFPYTSLLHEEKKLAQLKPVLVESEDQIGYIDSITKKILFQLQAEEVMEFSGRYAAVRIDSLWGYIDRNGNMVIAPLFNEAGDFVNGFAVVARGNCIDENCLYGMIDQSGKIILPLQYEEVYDMTKEGLALVKHPQNGYGYANRAGKITIPFQFKDAYSFSENTAAVQADSLWGYIDTRGNYVISPQFYKAGKFSGDMAPAADNLGLWGYIDKTGKWIISPRFHFANPFVNEKAIVQIKEKNKKGIEVITEKIIDRQGNYILQPVGGSRPSPPKGTKKRN